MHLWIVFFEMPEDVNQDNIISYLGFDGENAGYEHWNMNDYI